MIKAHPPGRFIRSSQENSMPGIARQFEPHVTRSGGTPAKYRFTVRCSACRKAETFEANKAASDDRIKSYFKERGWLLGRDQAYDLCPACLANPRERQQRHALPESATRLDRSTAPAEKRSRDTADILARHLGKPEALAAEVFRPKPVQAPPPSALDAPQQAAPAPALSREMEQALTGMAAELKSLRSTMELMAEQVSQLVALGGQQIAVVAQLAPLMIQSSERMSSGFQEVVRAVQTIPRPSAPTAEPQLTAERISDREQVEESSSNHQPDQAAGTTAPTKPGRPRQNQGESHQVASSQVAVKSIPDAKHPDRFYTTVRLPRELWDHSGFGPEHRIQMVWTGKALSIQRVSEGGVKPKTVGGTVVVLQSWKLGNLNLDQPKVTSGEGSLRLTVCR
jgi:hypothetical protein